MNDPVPDHIMNVPGRMEWATGLGLAQRHRGNAITKPQPDPSTVPAPTPAQPVLQVQGHTITGREMLVLQVPGGQVRYQGDNAEAEAKRLALAESATFVVVKPTFRIAPSIGVEVEQL